MRMPTTAIRLKKHGNELVSKVPHGILLSLKWDRRPRRDGDPPGRTLSGAAEIFGDLYHIL